MDMLVRFLKDENGMTVFEYALLSCVITTVTLGAMAVLGFQLLEMVSA